ncbi:MAG: TonB-dependent receptor [Sphingopyxis sp.]|nr:TonB-dependent receptor [Sphingopyxis sp.]
MIAEPAYAQAEPDDTAAGASTPSDPEIIVTARRRDEAEQDVPMSITVVGQQDLTERGVRTIADLPSVAPGLTTSYQAGRRGELVFSQRGQGQAFGGSAPGVATYFADVPDFGTAIYDLSNVAVLKGPQGTLFGRNTTGGAVLLTPAAPEAEWGGYLVGRLGNYERRDVEFAVTGPVAEGVQVRLSGQYLSRDGYAINIFDGRDVVNENKFSFRGALKINPVEGFENYTIFQYSRVKERGSDTQIVYINTNPAIASPFNPALAPPGTIDFSVEGPQAVADQLARGPRRINVDGGAFHYSKSTGVINTTTIAATDSLTLKNIFSYRKYRDGQTFDFDGSPLPIANTFNPIFGTRQITEEAQLQYQKGAFEATAGFYYEDRKTPPYVQFDFTTFWPYPDGAFGPLPQQGVYHAISFDVYARSKSRAFYAEASYTIADALELTLGIRRTHDDRSGGNSTAIVEKISGVPITVAVNSGEATFNATTWNASVVYKATDDLNLYATYRRGYKAGGVNTTSTGGLLFKPEYVDDYEAGIKYSGLVGGVRLMANFDAFYDDYTNIQRNVVLPGAVVSTETRNAASAKVKGFDVQFRVAPADIVDLGFAYSYIDAEYGTYTEPLYGDLSNSMFPLTPKHQFNVDLTLHAPVDDSIGEISARTNLSYQSKTAFGVTNTLNGNAANDLAVPTTVVAGRALINFRLDWNHIMRSNFSLGLFVTNLTDKTYPIASANLLNGPSFASTYSYGPPRMWGIEGRVEF